MERYVAALQTQVSRDFAPLWEYDAKLAYAAASGAGEGAWILQIEDGVETGTAVGESGAGDGGLPLLRVFAAPCQKGGIPISQAMSRQVLEALANPYVDRVVLIDNSDGTALAARVQVCQPVIASSYQIGSVTVSNFVTSAYFFRRPAGPYDFLRVLSAPLSCGKEGTQLVRRVTRLSEWLWRF